MTNHRLNVSKIHLSDLVMIGFFDNVQEENIVTHFTFIEQCIAAVLRCTFKIINRLIEWIAEVSHWPDLWPLKMCVYDRNSNFQYYMRVHKRWVFANDGDTHVHIRTFRYIGMHIILRVGIIWLMPLSSTYVSYFISYDNDDCIRALFRNM